jgi:hypothetical protein
MVKDHQTEKNCRESQLLRVLLYLALVKEQQTEACCSELRRVSVTYSAIVLAVMIFKGPNNLVANPNVIYSHSIA